MEDITNINWERLSEAAWNCRENSFLIGETKVGAAALSSSGNIYEGCNIEHKFRSHDIHAEVCTISKMVSNGDNKLAAILIVAKRERFTPCGSCMDWIFQFGGPACKIGFQAFRNGKITIYTSKEIMPFYPQ